MMRCLIRMVESDGPWEINLAELVLCHIVVNLEHRQFPIRGHIASKVRSEISTSGF